MLFWNNLGDPTDLYDKQTRIDWYLLIAWYLDSKSKVTNAQKTLDRLLEIEIFDVDYDILVEFFIYSLSEHYKSNIVKIFKR
jgi:hypothetical protein